MKSKLNIVLMLVIFITLLAGCGQSQEEKQIQNVVDNYFELLLLGDFEKSQEFLDKEYNYLEHSLYSIKNEDVLLKLYSKYTVNYEATEIDGNTAVTTLSIEHPNSTLLLNEQMSAFSLNMEDNAMSKVIDKKLDDPQLEMLTDKAYICLKKKQNNWEIITDDSFEMVVNLGSSDALDTEIVSENERKLEEIQSYIKDNVVLTDYLVAECEGYSGKVPGIKNISIKNNGDNEIVSLKLNLEFSSDNGTVLVTKEVPVIGMFDEPLRSNYSWKMENDKFFEIEDLSKEINLTKVNVSITEVTLQNTKNDTIVQSDEDKYIKEYLTLTNAKVSICESYDGKHPGLSRVSVKNNGIKNIEELTVTVYFQDASGKNIAEDSFLVIGSLFGGDTLKANYSWKMESDKFFEIENLADDVEIARYKVEISQIVFE